MFKEIKNVKPFTVVGMRYRGDNKNNEIKQLWDEFWPIHAQIKSISDPFTAYGICDAMDEESKEFEYMASVEVDDTNNIPANMISKSIEGGLYAVFVSTLSTIMEVYDYIMKEWLPASEYKRGNRPDFELYGSAFDPEDPKSSIYLHMPIDKK